ncbi:inorganic phosphate transporter [Salmonella enterica subsp. enterica]|nr:inorganic phosphate transporter [Salmonella enterica subsp. enterica]
MIYTRAMRSPQLAVVMVAAVFNFSRFAGGPSVACMPLCICYQRSSCSRTAFAMVFSMPSWRDIWNLGTSYFGLPASSSHTLIGAIIGTFNQCDDDRHKWCGCANIPKSYQYFRFTIIPLLSVWYRFRRSADFLLRRYWSGTKKRARIHLDASRT